MASVQNLTRFRLYPETLAAQHPLPKPPMFQFRVNCGGYYRFDVMATNEDDARIYVKRRHRGKIKSIELIGKVARHGA